MRMRGIAAALLLAAPLAAGHAAVDVPGHLIDPGRPRLEDPDRLVQGFLEAVERGELKVFGRVLDRAMIVPARVEYVYELSTRTTRVKVHADLTQPLPVPDHPDCQVRSVSAVLEDGAIVETESHVWIGR